MRRLTSFHKIAHSLSAFAGLNEDQYRQMLRDRYDVDSSKELSDAQEDDLVQFLNNIIPRPRLFCDNVRGVEFATPKQIRMLEAAFVERSYKETLGEKQDAFRKFILNHFGIPSKLWIGKSQVGALLKAIQSIKPKMEATHG